MSGSPVKNLSCFKAYDVRGRVPDELDAALAQRIGSAYARFLGPSRVVVGHDIRLSSPEIAQAVTRGLRESGVDVAVLTLDGPNSGRPLLGRIALICLG